MASEERIQAEKNAVLLDPLMYAVVKDHLTGAFPGLFNQKKSGCCWFVGRRGLVGPPVLWDLWGGGGVFLLEVQYSILKSLISTCVLSYVGSREDWLLDRICESKKDCWDSIRRTSYPYQ